MANRTKHTAEKGEALLEKLSRGYSITSACKAEAIHRRTYYDWREADPAFAAAADEAIDAGIDLLEDEAKRRAVGPMGSDTLLIFLLKSKRPSVYREKFAHEVSGADGGPVTMVIERVTRTVDK